MSPSVRTGVLLAFFTAKLHFQHTTIKNNIFITRFNACWRQRQNRLGSLPVRRVALAGPAALSSIVQLPRSVWWCCICILTSHFLSYWTRLSPSKHPVLRCGQGRELRIGQAGPFLLVTPQSWICTLWKHVV